MIWCIWRKSKIQNSICIFVIFVFKSDDIYSILQWNISSNLFGDYIITILNWQELIILCIYLAKMLKWTQLKSPFQA